MTIEEQILQSLLNEDQPGSLVYKKINTFDYVPSIQAKNTLVSEQFYSNYYSESISGYENSAVNLFYDETCDVSYKIITMFFGSSNGYGASSNQFAKSKFSDTKAIYSKINYMFDYALQYENIYAIEFHTNNKFDYLNSSFFQISLASYDGSGNLTTNIFSFISSGSSQYNEINKDIIIPMVSGSLSDGEYSNEEIGLLYPEKNIVVFNAEKLDSIVNYNSSYSTTSNEKNVNILYNSFSQSINISLASGVYPLISSGINNINLSRVTIDVELLDFNYTNNPTFFDSNTNKFRSSYTNTLQNVYFTTIGLYDSNYQLLAIGKLSKPLPKNDSEKYTFEIIIDAQ
jgi:hypothetical protein